jgi:DNA-directed RNA polymerase subunit beta'
VGRFQKAYASGFISNGERYNKIIDTWTHANNDVADAMVRHLERSKDGFNPVFMMMTSGARGNRDQMRQLAGMRGLMAKPQKKLTGGIGRDHRVAHQVELPRGPHRGGVLHLHPRCA